MNDKTDSAFWLTVVGAMPLGFAANVAVTSTSFVDHGPRREVIRAIAKGETPAPVDFVPPLLSLQETPKIVEENSVARLIRESSHHLSALAALGAGEREDPAVEEFFRQRLAMAKPPKKSRRLRRRYKGG